MTLKNKINKKLIGFTSLTILVCVILCTIIFYKLFQREVFRELKTYVYTISSLDNISEIETGIADNVKEDVRITVISSDGHVEYDSYVDSESMNNHKDRPEIVEANEKGEGTSTRRSDTFGKNTYYYAIKKGDGTYIRVSKETASIVSIFMSMFPIMLASMLVLWLGSVILSHFLTLSIVKPIENISNYLDKDVTVPTYKELEPFVEKISNQHKDIIKGAMMRQEFTANVSHELKTPLTAISGYSEIIENGMATGDDCKRFAGEIHKNSGRLLTLINDIIKLSQLDFKTESEIQKERINLNDVAQSCVDMLKVTAKNNDIALNYYGEDVYIMANREMMDELIINICGNAIRYNRPSGSVDVSVRYINNKVELLIKDTGIGIPKEDIDRVFERFYRVDKSRSKSTGGTGLGLAIVKHIIALHDNAALSIDSELGKGTSVKIEFTE